MKFFITAPFITVGWRWSAWRIQPIMPVTVDLPLVPPTATLRCAALSNWARSCGPGEVGKAELARADDVGDAVLDRARRDQGHALGEARAVLREQARYRASGGNRTWARGGRRRARGRSRRRGCPWRGRCRPRAACRCRRSRRRRWNLSSGGALLPDAAHDKRGGHENRGGRAELHAEPGRRARRSRRLPPRAATAN